VIRHGGDSKPKPPSTKETGTRAEQLVAKHLAEAGLEILAVNLRVGRLELDVVAREGCVIAVVEVRARGAGAWVRPLDSVDAKKQKRLRRAGEQLWHERFADDPRVERMRFDVAGVDLGRTGGASIEIVKAAF
jgi:putative endonuclease